MTIDQMSEIQEWLSPLDDYSAFNYTLQAVDIDCAEVHIEFDGDWVCDLYFSVKNGKMSVENPAESNTSLDRTTVWERMAAWRSF